VQIPSPRYLATSPLLFFRVVPPEAHTTEPPGASSEADPLLVSFTIRVIAPPRDLSPVALPRLFAWDGSSPSPGGFFFGLTGQSLFFAGFLPFRRACARPCREFRVEVWFGGLMSGLSTIIFAECTSLGSWVLSVVSPRGFFLFEGLLSDSGDVSPGRFLELFFVFFRVSLARFSSSPCSLPARVEYSMSEMFPADPF